MQGMASEVQLDASIVEDLMLRLDKSLRAIALYSPDHPAYHQTVKIAQAGFAPVWDLVSPLILEADNITRNPTATHGLNLKPEEVDAIIAFLHTLTDESYLTDPRFSNPFEELKQ